MTQSWPWDSQIAVQKDHKNVYLLRNNNNKEKQMYGGLILATYCTHIFRISSGALDAQIACFV